MKFNYECDGIDGLILIDEKYIDELDDNLLNELDILLDRYGKSELVYDFPNEKWDDVWRRETEKIVNFCNSGKMVIFLHYCDEDDCEIEISNMQIVSKTFINIKFGKLILVNASELIQCLAYPNLKMETILELDNVDVGKYSIKYEGINSIVLGENNDDVETNNVIEIL